MKTSEVFVAFKNPKGKIGMGIKILGITNFITVRACFSNQCVEQDMDVDFPVFEQKNIISN